MNAAGGSGAGGAGSAGAPTAGTGNTTFVCPAPSDVIGTGCVVDTGDALLDTSVTAAVTVTSVDDATTAPCDGGTIPAKRIELRAADDRKWSVIVAIDGLPGSAHSA